MKIRCAVAMPAIAVLALLSAIPATAAAKLEGLAYPDARKAIVRLGWTPVDGGCSGGGTRPRLCATYPEINNCSGTGAGFCNMLFERGQRCLFVVTVGGSPARYATVRSVRFDRGPCVKDA